MHASGTLGDRATREQKAKDGDELEQIGKRHPVGTPKVHVWKLGQGAGAIYAEDRLMVIVAVAALRNGHDP